MTDPVTVTPGGETADIAGLRQMAFQAESDPLFFKQNAGEIPPGTWEAVRESIRARYPYPEETEP